MHTGTSRTTTIVRGIQSVLFLYLSCAPCLRFYRHKKRLKQNKREHRERNAIQLATPEKYRQTSPYRTNNYWADEVRLGPGPPPQRLTKKMRQKIKADRIATSRAEKTLLPASSPSRDHGRKDSCGNTGEHSTVEGVRDMLVNAADNLKLTGEKWNTELYQREDEELWASDEDDPRTLESRVGPERRKSYGGSSFGFPRLGRFATAQAPTKSFYTARNPPVNDHHPPIVSNPAASRVSNKWMLQPPPSPSIMNGYRPATPSRSENGSGSGSGRSSRKGYEKRRDRDAGLGREFGVKLINEKMKMQNFGPAPDEEMTISVDAKWSEPHAREEMMYLSAKPTEANTSRKGSSDEFTIMSNSIIELNDSPSSEVEAGLTAPGTADSGVDVSRPSRGESSFSTNTLASTDSPSAKDSSIKGHAASDREDCLHTIDSPNTEALNAAPSEQPRSHITEVDGNIQATLPPNSNLPHPSKPKRAHLSRGPSKHFPRQYEFVSTATDDSVGRHLDRQLDRMALQLGVQKDDMAIWGSDWTEIGSASEERKWRRSVDF